ncbi:MAG: insulinase family protein, partial [Bacillota bacterium]|nr:insulinase family protein [Bacillota bacterium]
MIFNKKFYPDIRETLYTSTHKSGLKVFVLPKTGFTKSYAILGTKYGSVNNRFKGPKDTEITETPDGIAHYLEHKMFDQEDGSNVFDKFSKYGANANAFTGFTMTAYLFSATDHLYENLETLLDYTMHPYYTDETVAKEQGIIGQEIRMYEDDPGWNVYFNALYAMYQKHSVAIDIAG